MSDADRAQYAADVTSLSERELQDILAVAEPPVCLLGGWAVHVHVTEAFAAEHGRAYVGSRDVDLGVHVDPAWDAETLESKPVGVTLGAVESEMGYHRGRFGFYQYFHRETGKELDEQAATSYPRHQVFRVDVDVLPSTEDLDAFETAFGFRPPADPLLAPVFEDDRSEALDDYVSWDAAGALLAPRPTLAAMKVRAFPERDASHKRLKDLADLHALLWYGSDFATLGSAVRDRLATVDVERFRTAATDELFAGAATLIGVEADLVADSIRRALVGQ